jgi:hypothetical protein
VTVESVDGRTLEADVVVPCTGFRPDLDILRELGLNLDPAAEAPVELGPLIDPEFHSCGTVLPHGAALLAHPAKDFYIVGMKSYGRAQPSCYQPAQGNHRKASRLTPLGTAQLEKFRFKVARSMTYRILQRTTS